MNCYNKIRNRDKELEEKQDKDTKDNIYIFDKKIQTLTKMFKDKDLKIAY
jgi:hypothetical protein